MGSDAAYEAGQFVQACTIVPIVILFYDNLLTFSREVDCVWRRKFSAVTVLYVMQRYCLMLDITLRLIVPNARNVLSCHVLSVVVYTSDILSLLGVALFSSLRTWAICGRLSLPLVLVFLSSIFIPCINIYNYSRPVFYEIVDGTCITSVRTPDTVTNDIYFPIITRCVAVFADALVIIITWIQSASTLRASRQLEAFKPKMSIILFRNGAMYFVAMFVLNVVTLALNADALYHVDSGTAFIYISEVIAPTLIARFILDLRSVYYPTDDDSNITGLANISSVKFVASRYIGNLAAPIGEDTTWNSGPSDDVAADRGNQHEVSKEPFLLGLVDNGSDNDVHLSPHRPTMNDVLVSSPSTVMTNDPSSSA